MKMETSVECKLMAEERKHVSFSSQEMTNLLDGGKEKTAMRHRIENIILNDPRMKAEDISCMSFEQQHIHGVKRMIYFYTDLVKKMKWDFTKITPEMEFLPRTVGLATSLMLHPSAFIPTVVSLGTKEQVDIWYPLSREYFILGAYAQTELGHGTNLRGLETTATFDTHTQEFELHCPKLTSMKWWPGEMAAKANHALVMAQLITRGHSHGMHAFIVQIRDLDNHRPLPGISVGSIGSIMAIGGSDNGYLKLDHVRIPKENMLSKYAEVKSDGSYLKKGNDRLMYASMVNLRVLMTKNEAVLALQKACTIAARYSCVRRQGSLQPGKPEIPIIDYITQQHKILPQIAAAYAFHFTIDNVKQMYKQYLKDLSKGNLENLPEVHITTAGIKATLTDQCMEGIEIVRRACGGHGYSDASGIPIILNRATGSCTYEGENTVMYLQCARYLIKCASKIYMGQPVHGSFKYLSQPTPAKCGIESLEECYDLNILLDCLKHCAQAMLMDTASSMQSLVSDGMSHMEAWNLSSVQLVCVAKAHMLQYIVSSFASFINNSECSTTVREVLYQLCALYALHQIIKDTRGLLKDGYLSGPQCTLMEKAEVNLLKSLRKDTVGLVDAFDFHDDILVSCLGAYDGNVYERLFEYAKKSPLNKQEVHAEIYSYLRPHLHVGRDKLRETSTKAKL